MLSNLTNILPIFCLITSYTESAEKFCEKDFCQENGVKIYSELNGLDQYDPKLIEKLKIEILVKPKKGPLNSLRPPQPQSLKGGRTIKEFLGCKATFFYEHIHKRCWHFHHGDIFQYPSTGGPQLTRKTLPWFLAYVGASGGFLR